MTLAEQLTHSRAEIATLRADKEHLQFQLDQLKRLIFGHRAERIDTLAASASLPLFDELTATPKEAEPEPTWVPAHARQKPTRKSIPDHLPREVITLDLPRPRKPAPAAARRAATSAMP